MKTWAMYNEYSVMVPYQSYAGLVAIQRVYQNIKQNRCEYVIALLNNNVKEQLR